MILWAFFFILTIEVREFLMKSKFFVCLSNLRTSTVWTRNNVDVECWASVFGLNTLPLGTIRTTQIEKAVYTSSTLNYLKNIKKLFKKIEPTLHIASTYFHLKKPPIYYCWSCIFSPDYQLWLLGALSSNTLSLNHVLGDRKPHC